MKRRKYDQSTTNLVEACITWGRERSTIRRLLPNLSKRQVDSLVYEARKRLGLVRRREHPPAVKKKALNLLAKGKNSFEISRNLKIPSGTIRAWRKLL